MANVQILNVVVLDKPCPFKNPFQFANTFERIENLPDDLKWKIIYEKCFAPGMYNVATGDYLCCAPQKRVYRLEMDWGKEPAKSPQIAYESHQKMRIKKQILKEKMGPGKYEFKDFLELKKTRPSSIRGLFSAGEERFRDPAQFCIPGPGTYGNPYMVLEEKATRSGSSRGILDSRTKKCELFARDDSLGPGTYNLKDLLTEFLNRVVSKRGPYETFTEDRSKPILHGYLAAPKQLTDSGPYAFKDFNDEMKSKRKSVHGKFSKASREQRFRSEGPGPAAYDIRCLSADKKQNILPFCSSAKRSLYFPNDNPVGVGRYNIAKPMTHKSGTCCKAVFMSKAGRYLSNLKQDKSWQERLRPTNIPLADRVFLAPPDEQSDATAEAICSP
ncbi:ciliary microtubule-associated protein 2 [Microcaecilia unicolor]|uniref:Lymphocyte expansion molecule n=1 Tax=Microcaecilia unicolor TaxID=1415580 RepID=A0A6P7YEI2_9AMPH|nr:lymphocyte expansion molecule [Microcaecilia unicolor]